MNRFELLKETKEKGLLAPLVSSGCISFSVTTWLAYYEYFLEELKTERKPNAVKNTADHFDVSDRQIYKVINFFEC